MKPTPLIVLMLAVLGCTEPQAPVGALPETVVGIDINSQEPRFTFVAPDGFIWNDEHKMFHNQATRTSVTLAHAPGTSFQTVVDDFVSDRMLSAGMELTTKETRDVGGRPTLLVKGNRVKARYPQQFCTVAFGTTTGCAQITAIYPADVPDLMKARIETSLLESTYGVPESAEQSDGPGAADSAFTSG